MSLRTVGGGLPVSLGQRLTAAQLPHFYPRRPGGRTRGSPVGDSKMWVRTSLGEGSPVHNVRAQRGPYSRGHYYTGWSRNFFTAGASKGGDRMS